MSDTRRYTVTIRCRTWHTWPEKTVFASKWFQLKLSDDLVVTAGVAVATYLARPTPSDYTTERAEIGPLVWRGSVPGVFTVGGTALKAPEDTLPVSFDYEPPRKGEVDILVAIDSPREVPTDASDILRSIALAFLSLINLRLGDHLLPSAPLQVSCRQAGGRESSNVVQVRVERRDQLHPDVIQEVSNEFFNLVERGSGKVQTALELCAAHLSENSVKTRFLLLVMAIEVLTTATSKHPAALALLEKWHEDLNSERQKYEASAPERTALDALERELMFRREDSIRSQVRRLLVRVAASDPVRFGDLPTRGVKIYDKRSVLVHDGTLSESELSQLEVEAREIVQAALRHSLAELQTIGPG